jgi:hypothetical protein
VQANQKPKTATNATKGKTKADAATGEFASWAQMTEISQ